MHGHRIENPVDGGQNVGLGNEGWLDAELNRAIRVLADDGEQLDDVAEIFCEIDVGGTNLFDAGDVDRGGIDWKSVGECGKENRLVGGVPAIHVECWVGLCVAECLRLAESGFKSESSIGHAAENVI